MRGPIPPEDVDEVVEAFCDSLSFLDSRLRDELVADYLLGARACMDIEELRCALEGAEMMATAVVCGVPVADLLETTERLAVEALSRGGPERRVRSVVVLFRAPWEFELKDLALIMRRVDALCGRENLVYIVFGDFIDPDATAGKIRIFVTW